MRKPLHLGPPHAKLGLFEWFFACALATTLTGCATTQPQQRVPVEPVQTEQSVPEEPSPCADLSLRELERQAIDMLDRGESEQARELLKCALDLNPSSYVARILNEQLDADPVEYLGWRNYRYTVKSKETLSRIAQERLGSSLKFVILARYNDIDVPANLVAGQFIKIPGDEPTETGPLTPAPQIQPQPQPQPSTTSAEALRDQALAMEDNGDLKKAYELIKQAKAADAELEGIETDYSRIQSAIIGDLENKAYNQELSGTPEQAIATWRKVLEIDPANIPAQLSINRLAQ